MKKKLQWFMMVFGVAFLLAASVLDKMISFSTKFWRSNANVAFAPLPQQTQLVAIQKAANHSDAINISNSDVMELFAGIKHMQEGVAEKKRQAERIRPIVNETALASRLPQRPSKARENKKERILVVYSGPTDVMDADFPLSKYRKGHKKIVLYRLNFEFFLEHGIQCKTQDTILVVTDIVARVYQFRIEKLHRDCQEHGNSVILAIRNNTCLDLESVRVALYGGYVDVSSYDYFVYTNCGVSGPSPRWASLPWTDVFLAKLNDKIRMTGLSMNCRNFRPHIQSMMYAMDRTALALVMEEGAIYDCESNVDRRGESQKNKKKSIVHGNIVNGYEIRMSQLILQEGYGISPILRPLIIFSHNTSQCKDGAEPQKDLWITWRLEDYFGKLPSLDEVIFFKTSRILTPETAKQLNFTMQVDWNW